MYHDNRGRLSAHHTLLPNITMITEAGSLLTTPCYLTCIMITEAGSLLTTPCYLTCTMITEEGCLITTPCFLTCTIITEAGSLLTTPCYLTCTLIAEAGTLLTAPCYLTGTMVTYIYYILVLSAATWIRLRFSGCLILKERMIPRNPRKHKKGKNSICKSWHSISEMFLNYKMILYQV